MQLLVDLLTRYGLALIFIVVLIEQIGLPLPSYPFLAVGAALSAHGRYSAVQLVMVAVLACLLADCAWYLAGARFGRRVLALMCRISLSPDNCVRQSEGIYERWGARSLLVAKFLPGFAAVATAMAGVMALSPWAFALYDAIGATLWSGLAAALGWTFRDAIDDVLGLLESAGRIGLALIASLLAIYVLTKFVQRQQLLRQLRMARVSAQELHSMLTADQRPLIIDVRTAGGRAGGVIPGAIALEAHASDAQLRNLPLAEEVIVYCACPNEASAASMAKRLMKAGFRRVRPLHGGIDAWVASGLPLDDGEPAPQADLVPQARQSG